MLISNFWNQVLETSGSFKPHLNGYFEFNDSIIQKRLTLATPAATTPTPTSETNLTLTMANGLAHFKS